MTKEKEAINFHCNLMKDLLNDLEDKIDSPKDEVKQLIGMLNTSINVIHEFNEVR